MDALAEASRHVRAFDPHDAALICLIVALVFLVALALSPRERV